MNRRKKYGKVDFFLIIILGILSLICILPFVNLFAISLSSSGPAAAGKVGLWPVGFTTAAYEYVLESGAFLRAFWMSIKRVLIGTTVNLVFMLITAYPLSKPKKQFRARGVIITFFFITMLIGGGLIPTYLVVTRLGLKDSIWALVLPGALPVYNMIILMNFMRGLPYEMEEAAIIDGATPFQILLRVYLPVLKPGLATVGLFSALGHWNDWFSGMIYMTNPQNYPLQTYMQSLLKNFDRLLMSNFAREEMQVLLSQMNARTGRAAQLFLGMIPILIIYPFLQKYFTKGLVLGSVKG